ncbi:MAG: GerMN domain-containing protein [Lachnospiraceae bacterium]|nr:GerMN domain-containing protein [Lachnospiraceae bacterium]
MKNRNKAVLAIVAVTALLAACGSRVSETVASGEMVVPEMSSEDLLVTSLEYLLLDEEEETQEPQELTAEETPDTQESEQEPEVPEADNSESTPVTEEQESEPEEVLTEKAVVYYGNGASHELNQETVELEEMTPEALTDALAKHNIVSLDTKVLSFKEELQDEQKVLHLDLSKAAGEYLRTMSKEAECIIVASIVNTFLENYEADTIYLKVEGEALVTSHTEYTEAVGQCTVDELINLVMTSDKDEVQSKLPLIQEKK